jgi:flagellar hook-associated protein 3 FlgL
MQRVTTLNSTTLVKDWLTSSSQKIQKHQQEVSTGIALDRASAAPGDAAELLRNQRSLKRLEQLQRNSASARLWLDTADTAMNDAVGSLTRARIIAVQGANGVNNVESQAALAAELRSIAQEMISLANTTVNNRPIFAGTADTQVAYDASGSFQGDTGQVIRAVTPTDSFAIAASGPAVFGTPDGADPLNGTVFQVLGATAAAVEAGDVAATRAGMEALDAALSRMQGEIGRLGGLSTRLEEVESRNAATQIFTQAQISGVRDADMAESILRLRSAETSYEATLSAASRSLSRSLLDFLR